MGEPEKDALADLGIYRDRMPARGLSVAEKLVLTLTVLWVLAAGAYLFLNYDGGDQAALSLRFIITLLAIFLPVATIWVGLAAARSARVIREETSRLEAAIEALRADYLKTQSGAGGKSNVERKLEEIAAAQRQTDAAIATFTTIRSAATSADRDYVKPALPVADEDADDGAEEQGLLALTSPPGTETPPVGTEDFIRALNFPENAEDKEGFQALRRALRNRNTARLVQAAQDVLTLLSQDGIFMDDLMPDRARPEVWRQFAEGERGRSVAALGGVRDRSCLALTSGRMRQDPVFRDSAHHFLRRFDQTFAAFEKSATDGEIAALSDTRTARAFMLLGRVSGTFD